MDAACHRALAAAGGSAPHRRYIEGILKRGLDRALPQAPPVTPRSAAHEFVRGPNYFDQKEDHDHRRDDSQVDRNELHTLAKSLREMLALPPDKQLSFEEKLALLVDQEWTERENRKFSRRIRRLA